MYEQAQNYHSPSPANCQTPSCAAQAVPASRWRACAAHTSAAQTLPHLRFTAHLVAGIVHQDVDPVKVLDSLVHDLPASARSMHQGHCSSTTWHRANTVYQSQASQRLHVQHKKNTQMRNAGEYNTRHCISAWDEWKLFTGRFRLQTGRRAPAPPCGQPPQPPAASPARMPACPYYLDSAIAPMTQACVSFPGTATGTTALGTVLTVPTNHQ